MKVLYLAANPARVLPEIHAIQRELRGVDLRDEITFIPHATIDPADFSRALQEHRPELVHLSGGGDRHEGLRIGAHANEMIVLPQRPLIALFELLRDNLGVVVLCAPDTWRMAKQVSAHVPLAIGMDGALSEVATTAFSVGFYQAVGFGKSFLEAFELGKIQASLSDSRCAQVPKMAQRPGGTAKPPHGAYRVVLLHPERAAPVELRTLLEKQRKVDSESAWALIESPPSLVAERLSWDAAEGLWTTMTRLGAIASVETDKGTPTGRTFVRTPSGLSMGVLPGGASLPSFWLLQTPVSQALFARVMGSNPSHFRDDTLPVEHVTFEEAQELCRRLSHIDGLTRNPYRLPTEAEWEHAARAGETTRFAGSNRWADVAWAGAAGTFSIDTQTTKRPNAWGLFQMSGNVWEWVAPNAGAPDNGMAIAKGGCFCSPESEIEIEARRLGDPRERSFTGLRIARTAP